MIDFNSNTTDVSGQFSIRSNYIDMHFVRNLQQSTYVFKTVWSLTFSPIYNWNWLIWNLLAYTCTEDGFFPVEGECTGVYYVCGGGQVAEQVISVVSIQKFVKIISFLLRYVQITEYLTQFCCIALLLKPLLVIKVNGKRDGLLILSLV